MLISLCTNNKDSCTKHAHTKDNSGGVNREFTEANSQKNGYCDEEHKSERDQRLCSISLTKTKKQSVQQKKVSDVISSFGDLKRDQNEQSVQKSIVKCDSIQLSMSSEDGNGKKKRNTVDQKAVDNVMCQGPPPNSIEDSSSLNQYDDMDANEVTDIVKINTSKSKFLNQKCPKKPGLQKTGDDTCGVNFPKKSKRRNKEETSPRTDPPVILRFDSDLWLHDTSPGRARAGPGRAGPGRAGPMKIWKSARPVTTMHTGVYSVTISLLAVQFIYRYWALFSLNHLTYFHGCKSLIWAVYCIFFGGIWLMGSYNLLEMDDVAEKYFEQEMLIRYSVSVKEIPAFTFLAYEPEDGLIRGKNASHSVLINSIMAFQYGVMIFCGWNMHSKMEEKIAHFSLIRKHHNRQLFKALVFQISTPTIFLFSPLIIFIYLPYFQIELSLPGGAIMSLFNMYPAMDSIIILIIVTEYRIAARKVLSDVIRATSAVFRAKSSSTSQTTGQIELPTIRTIL
ncbi:hypothetical protein CRE_13131 [Caenorhabditis remanei]|uniref:Uncharacterized protein n=1 Tax=Caenorhabditis remanei TaxID=31234 RepID=E3NJL5_CAERE|nr:hypothetical protein CRE_13131 [Caenorhabditis remanei]